MSSLLASLLKDSLSEQSKFIATAEPQSPPRAAAEPSDAAAAAHNLAEAASKAANAANADAEESEEEMERRVEADRAAAILLLPPSLQSSLRLIASNPHLILHTGEDAVPNIFFSLHCFIVTKAILDHYPDMAAATLPHNHNRPIHSACQVQHVDVATIRLLLSLVPDTCAARNSDGKLPLHLAAANPTTAPQIFTLLHTVHPGGAAQTEHKNGSLPLHYACAFKAPLETVQLLLKLHPAALRHRDKQSNLPLHLALLYRAPHDVIEFLLEAWPESIAQPDGKARLPLHLATIATHDPPTISLLLSLYPAAACMAIQGKKPIHYAIRQKGRVETVKLLLTASNAQVRVRP